MPSASKDAVNLIAVINTFKKRSLPFFHDRFSGFAPGIHVTDRLLQSPCSTSSFRVAFMSHHLSDPNHLFSNSAIDRTLSHEARETFLSAIVGEGRAEWLDKGHRKCLVLWHRIQDWADIILQFVRENGLEDSVMTVEEIRSGTESLGTELSGIDKMILMRALKLLENKGKLALFKGTSADDEGLKFSV